MKLNKLTLTRKKFNKGFTLVEVGIVVILLTLITAAKLREEARDLRISIAQSQGQQLKVLNSGLYTYGMRHFNEVVSNSAVAGVAITRAPTVAELVALGDLTSGFSPNGYYGATYVTSIEPAPAACVAPNCNIAGLVYLNQPINDPFTGTVDGPSIGEAVTAIGADGGSSLRVPATIQGANGGWSVPNPLPAIRGILAARSGLGSELDLTGYLKRDGSLPMSGTLDLGNNSIKNLSTVVEGAACATTGLLSEDVSGALLTCQGGVQTRQGSAFWRDPVLNVAALPVCNVAASGQTRIVRVPTVGTGPRAYVCTGVSWIPIAVDDSGNLTIAGIATTGKVQVNDVVTAATACSPNGLVARDATGLLLSCQNGTWKGMGGGTDVATFSAIGGTKLPSGVMIKWGYLSANGFSAFQSPFPAYCASVTFGSGGPLGSANGVPRGSCTVSGVNYSSANVASTPTMYMAIGW